MSFTENEKTPKASATQERIYQTALKLFCKKGFEQSSMREISKQANVALGATYYYFKSKDAIVMEFYAQTQKEIFIKVQTNNRQQFKSNEVFAPLLFC